MAGLGSFFKKRRDRSVDPSESAVPEGVDLTVNDGVERRQRMLLLAGGSLLVIAAAYWLFFTGADGGNEVDIAAKQNGQNIQVSTDDLASKNLSEKEWLAMSENRLTAQDNQIRALRGQGRQFDDLQSEIDALRSENQNMASDGSRVVSAYESENQQLKQQLALVQANAVNNGAGPRALYGPQGPAGYAPQSGDVPLPALSRGELKVINFASTTGAAGLPVTAQSQAPERGNMVVTDSPSYLPANSYARARVIVGVDAASSVQSQSDPLPVVLRITGPARSVMLNGKVLTTRIEGCLVNGAARGDLSSEKVYVRLAKMTCPQPGGRFAESEVKGFIAFGGKTGVRGRVVSREGSLTMQAFMAGLVSGVGSGFGANTQGVLSGNTTVVNGKREKLSTGEIAQGALGEGVAQAGDMLSQYLIERAEQYQPVIEKPTGIEVEIVFLEGVFIRN